MTICLLVTLHCFLVPLIKMRRSQSDRRGKKQSRHLPWLEPWGQWHEWMWWWCKSSLLWPDSTLYHCGVSDDQLQTQNVVERSKILRSCIKKGFVVACFLFYSVFQNFKARIRYNHIENMAVLWLAMAPHCQVASSSCLLDRHFDTFPHASWLSILSCTKLRDIGDGEDDDADDDDLGVSALTSANLLHARRWCRWAIYANCDHNSILRMAMYIYWW